MTTSVLCPDTFGGLPIVHRAGVQYLHLLTPLTFPGIAPTVPENCSPFELPFPHTQTHAFGPPLPSAREASLHFPFSRFFLSSQSQCLALLEAPHGLFPSWQGSPSPLSPLSRVLFLFFLDQEITGREDCGVYEFPTIASLVCPEQRLRKYLQNGWMDG